MTNKTFTTGTSQHEFTVFTTEGPEVIEWLSSSIPIADFVGLRSSTQILHFDQNGEYMNFRLSGYAILKINFFSDGRYYLGYNPNYGDTDRKSTYLVFLTKEQADGIIEHHGGSRGVDPNSRPTDHREFLEFGGKPPLRIGSEIAPEAAAKFHFDKNRKIKPEDTQLKLFFSGSEKDEQRRIFNSQVLQLKAEGISGFTLASLAVCFNNIFNLMHDTLLGETSSVLTEMIRLNKQQDAKLDDFKKAILHLNSKLPGKEQLKKPLLNSIKAHGTAGDITLSGPIALVKQLTAAQGIIDATEFTDLHDSFNGRNKAKVDPHDYYILAHRALDSGYDERVAAAIIVERNRMDKANEKIVEPEPAVETPDPDPVIETPVEVVPTETEIEDTPDEPVAEIEVPEPEISESSGATASETPETPEGETT